MGPLGAATVVVGWEMVVGAVLEVSESESPHPAAAAAIAQRAIIGSDLVHFRLLEVRDRILPLAVPVVVGDQSVADPPDRPEALPL
jgi:hypothetical protein